MGVGEYFLQRRADSLARRIPELHRQELEALVARATEYGSTSEVLWAHEHPAHALRQEHLAFNALLAALEHVRSEWLQNEASVRRAPAAPPSAPAELAPAELAPAELAPAELAPAELAPAELAPAEPAPAELAPAAPASVLAVPAPSQPSPQEDEHDAPSGESRYQALPLFRFSKREKRAVLAAMAAKAVRDFPESNDGVTREHQALYNAWLRGREALTPQLLTLLPSVASIAALRRRRMTVALGSVVVSLACALYAFRGWSKGFTVLASGTFGTSFAEQAATDNDEDTEWLLPEAQDGFIEVAFNRPRTLSRVKILNAHNPPYNDRATRDFELLVFSTDGPPLALKRTFPTLATSPTWMTIDIPPEAVKRLRIEVKNYHKRGGGFAEIAWE